MPPPLANFLSRSRNASYSGGFDAKSAQNASAFTTAKSHPA
jgi:hypothetical protein